MSRAVKDELLGTQEERGAMGQFGLQPTMNSIQIPLSSEMQETITQVVLDDYSKAKNDRDSRDYGTTSKGEKMDFEFWHRRIKDMYSGYRIPKTIPWKFCSNRSLRIATAILEMLCSRLFGAVWQEDLCRWRAGEISDVPKVERISKFMDWEIPPIS